MIDLYRPLELPVPFLKKNFDKTKYANARHKHLDRSDISDLYYSFIENLDLRLNHAEVFFSLPNIYYPIHRDQHNLIDFPKINFVYGGDNSKMNWYKIKEGREGISSYTNINTAFVQYELNDVDLIFSQEIKSPSLVQAGVPHNVTSPTLRWSVSTVYTTKNNKLLSWNEICSIFNDYSFYTKL